MNPDLLGLFFFKQKTAYEITTRLVGSGDVYKRQPDGLPPVHDTRARGGASIGSKEKGGAVLLGTPFLRLCV